MIRFTFALQYTVTSDRPVRCLVLLRSTGSFGDTRLGSCSPCQWRTGPSYVTGRVPALAGRERGMKRLGDAQGSQQLNAQRLPRRCLFVPGGRAPSGSSAHHGARPEPSRRYHQRGPAPPSERHPAGTAEACGRGGTSHWWHHAPRSARNQELPQGPLVASRRADCMVRSGQIQDVGGHEGGGGGGW